MNHECYRIYESLSYLSLPILEENLNHVKGKRSNCDQNNAYRLLKEFNAPIKYIHNWTTDLNDILIEELNLNLKERQNRRIKLYEWYEKFKMEMKNRLINLINQRFDCL